MSEKDLETAFSQITLAFRCDQYTLKQRLQAEEHARNLAEENIQLELTRGRETLEMLKGLCLDSKRSKILQRLELSLDILGGTVERISNTAEVLGAVHQEARVSRAVELMVAHVENLRRRHDRNTVELEEARKAIQQQNMIDPRASSDPEEGDTRKRSSQQNLGRRRISISLISGQTKEKRKRDLRKRVPRGGSPSHSSESSCSVVTKDDTMDDRPLDPDETPSEASAAPPPPSDPPPHPQHRVPAFKTSGHQENTKQKRHKGKAVLSKRKSDKDKKSANVYRRISAGSHGSLWRHRPLALWLYRCRWAVLCLYLFVLFCIVTLTYLLWKIHDEEFEL
ncbi:inositol 1,4,5-triphosphate receptor associated 2 isoform X1 [Lates japonicus]|uniref:Inositol 1,4,5-triphosphate receptor associated 2 isoform X1 n=1 Tax=Lates japonicus TaxID=270547 RepID=A0AAD3M1R3_LATJO|nr:inositol 1,4,5-triphosphate receptor associated 2 isoform X1 [Lates japonicus]